MSEKNGRDLTTEELLKKLMENFGTDEPTDEGKQLSIEDAASDRSSKRKVYHYRVKDGADGRQEEDNVAPEGVTQDLERHILDAERYMETMEDSLESGEQGRSEASEISENEGVGEENRPHNGMSDESEEEESVSAVYIDSGNGHEENRAFNDEKETQLRSVPSPKEPREAPKDREDRKESEEKEASFFDFDGGESREVESELSFENFTEDSGETERRAEDLPTEAESSKKEKEEQSGGAEEKQGEEKPLDDSEVDLMMIFEMDKLLEERVGSRAFKKISDKVNGDAKAETVEEEYEEPAQNAKFFERFRKGYTFLTVRAFLALLAFVLVAAGEILLAVLKQKGTSAGAFFHTTFLDNPVFAALIAMQVTMLLLAVGYKEFLTGLRAIGAGRAVPEVFLTLTGLITLIYEGGMIKCHSVNAVFYNLPLALCVLLSVFHGGINLIRKMLAFKVISSKKRKFAVTNRRDKDSSLEKEAFGEFLSDTSGVYGTEKASFIRGFGRRTAREPHYKGIIGIFATTVTVIGLIFFVLGFYFSAGDEKLLSAFQTAMQSVLFTIPFSAFLTYCLPFAKASVKAFRMESAIIGESSLEEYSDATVISFDDKEVFPSKGVRVRSLKLYGDSRIDHVLFGAASVFHRLGGPLDEVFGVATKESGYSEEVDILEIEKDGVEAAVKGVRVYVGGSSFMKRRGLLPSVDPEEEAMEMDGRMSIMYLAIDGELSAKMYVEYKPDGELQDIMAALYKAGMCIGVRTLDPNIDDKMLRTHVDLSKYPVKVLRMDKISAANSDEPIDSGVVSKRSVKDLLKTLTYCRRVLQVIKADTIIKVVGILVGVGVSALILFLGLTGQVNSLWVTVYQLLMLLPVLLVSLIFV